MRNIQNFHRNDKINFYTIFFDFRGFWNAEYRTMSPSPFSLRDYLDLILFAFTGKSVAARRNSVVAHIVLLLLFVYPNPRYLQTFVIRDCYFLPYFLSKQSWCLTAVIFMGGAPFIEIFCSVNSAGRLHIHSDTLLFLFVRSLCVNCDT